MAVLGVDHLLEERSDAVASCLVQRIGVHRRRRDDRTGHQGESNEHGTRLCRVGDGKPLGIAVTREQARAVQGPLRCFSEVLNVVSATFWDIGEVMLQLGIVVFPGFQLISLAAVPVFELANALQETPIYDLRLISEPGGAVRSSGGVSVQTERLGQLRYDTILVVGGASRLSVSQAMIDFIKFAASTSRRVTATCTGAFVLAAAGLLDGKRATTHWQYAVALRRDYPRVRVEEDRIFIKDGAVWTSAGMTAVIDLALAMVEEDLGRDISKA